MASYRGEATTGNSPVIRCNVALPSINGNQGPNYGEDWGFAGPAVGTPMCDGSYAVMGCCQRIISDVATARDWVKTKHAIFWPSDTDSGERAEVHA